MKCATLKHGNRGITLIELVTVVLVVGILAAIAVPAYSTYVVRVNRTDAKSALMLMANNLERCFSRGYNYTIQETGSAAACVALPWTNPEDTYTVTGDITANTFLLTATPINSQTRDTKCGAFTLNQTGTQGVTGSLSPRKCWDGRD